MTGELADDQEYLFRLTEIDWDTDGEEVDLPETLDVWAMGEDDAVDVATDEMGWCIFGACVELLPDEGGQ